MWATASLWLLGAGMVALPIAAIVGFTSSAGDHGTRDAAAWRQIGNFLALTLFNWYPRYKYAASAGILPFGIWISLTTFSMLMFSDLLRSKLVYRHRVAAADISSGDPSPVPHNRRLRG